MPTRAVSVLDVVTAVQGAVAQDFGRENRAGNALVVSKVEIELKTALETTQGGEVEWKVVSVGGQYANSQTQTLCLSWERTASKALTASDAEDLGYELLTGLDALRIGAEQWSRLSGHLPFVSTGGTLAFQVAVTEDGHLTVLKLGAGQVEALTHTVTLTLQPLD
ncbi:hypothetical protein HNQ07_002047 [Deinococcus metalli]|uniref:Trypsin-co-occurring domain-containing protein n=1 Tax=Deinococcus metalli TaxID=1141878 RepID=A0A7W8KGA6_9DEIO|nr:trypco2 family protein [Deinococcus metalli]MBB5376583.1 hypothetical protein [Deinococcus metalli]GHF42985.1 hypothetical protein GCM10017781_19190 [Deinococcus metalli]